MEILKYACPQSKDEAFRLIREEHGTAIGGAAWLRTNTKTIALGVDLADLGLEYVREVGDHIEIGAMTTYRELETNPLLRARFGALFETTVSHVVGVQLRNIITVGGTVTGRYGFSDLNTTLCALSAQAVFYPDQTMDLAQFIERGVGAPFCSKRSCCLPRPRAFTITNCESPRTISPSSTPPPCGQVQNGASRSDRGLPPLASAQRR